MPPLFLRPLFSTLEVWIPLTFSAFLFCSVNAEAGHASSFPWIHALHGPIPSSGTCIATDMSHGNW